MAVLVKLDWVRSVGAASGPWGRYLRRKRAERAGWVRHLEAIDAGLFSKADRIARRLLGIRGRPMTAEVKARLRASRKGRGRG